MLHLLYQLTGDKPEDIWAQPAGTRAFKIASMMLAVEEKIHRRG
jgi:hypothetical protein